MDRIKATPGYAETQIRLLLSDINSPTHNVRVKAITKFQDYIKTYKPEVYDDDVDLLYRGLVIQGVKKGVGLLECCGLDSEKHAGQLKRVASPAIGLVRWLISSPEYGNDNIFYDRFVQLHENEYLQMKLALHINQETKSQNSARVGNSADAYVILTLLLRDHRNPDSGEQDPLSLSDLLSDKTAREKFSAWFQKTSQQALDTSTIVKRKNIKVIRPTVWGDVKLKPIPFQDGEDAGDTEEVVETVIGLAVPDPLGLKDIDLKERQEAFANGLIALPSNQRGVSNKVMSKRQTTSPNGVKSFLFESDSDDDENNDASSQSSEEPAEPEQLSSKEASPKPNRRASSAPPLKKKLKPPKESLLPRDKNFSASLFLRLIHQDINFEDFKTGLGNLETKLNQQSNQRENLVRENYGLFIECTEGIAWLKDFRDGKAALSQPKSPINNKATQSASQLKIDAVLRKGETGEAKLNRGEQSLNVAKREAQKTLAPILDRMRRSKKIRSADKVLRRLATTLEYPHRMLKALEKEDYNEVINIFQRIQAIPTSSSLRLLQRVRESAESIIKNTKSKCVGVLLTSSNGEVSQLLRHAKIIRDLEGDDGYYENLKLCYASQVNFVADNLLRINTKFMENAAGLFEGNNNGRPPAGPSQSKKADNLGSARDVQRDIIREIKRRWLMSKQLLIGNSSTKRKSNKYQDNVEDAFEISGDDDKTQEDEFNMIFERDLNEGLVDQDVLDDGLDSSADIRSVLSVKERVEYMYEVIDCMKLWIPCLQRLASELQTVTVAISSGIRGISRTQPQQPTKLLSVVLTSFSDILRQCLDGFSTDIGKSITDAVQLIKTNNTGLPVPQAVGDKPPERPLLKKRGSFIGTPVDLSHSQTTESQQPSTLSQQESLRRTQQLRILASTYFQSKLPEFCQLSMLREISDLYDSMDILFSGATVSNSAGSNKNTTTSSLGSADTRLQKSSPFYDPLAILRESAKEGEIIITQRIVYRLLEIILTSFSSYTSTYSDEDAGDSTRDDIRNSFLSKRKSERYSVQRVESMTKNFQDLMLRAVQKFTEFIHRPDWISSVVFDGFQRAIVSFTEILRKEYNNMGEELFQLQQARARSNTVLSNRSRSANSLIPNRHGSVMDRKRSSTLRDMAPMIEAVDLDGLDNELKLSCAPAAEKSSLLIDVLRALIHLRTRTIPLVLGNIYRIFVNAGITDDSRTLETQPAIDTIIGRLFGNTTKAEKTSLSDRLNVVAKELEEIGGNATVMAVVYELTSLEESVCNAILETKTAPIRASVITYFTILAKREAALGKTLGTPDISFSSLPAHLAKVLLVLGFEKVQFETALGGLSVEFGSIGSTADSRLKYSTNRSTVDPATDSDSNSENVSDDEASEEGYTEKNTFTPSHGSSSSSGNPVIARYTILAQKGRGEQYSKYIFKELCLRVANGYLDLIKKLATNTFLVSKQSAIRSPSVSSNQTTPRALGQAIEECEYLRNLMKQVLPSEPALQTPIPTVSVKGSGSQYPSAEQLQRAGRMYGAMIMR